MGEKLTGAGMGRNGGVGMGVLNGICLCLIIGVLLELPVFYS